MLCVQPLSIKDNGSAYGPLRVDRRDRPFSPLFSFDRPRHVRLFFPIFGSETLFLVKKPALNLNLFPNRSAGIRSSVRRSTIVRFFLHVRRYRFAVFPANAFSNFPEAVRLSSFFEVVAPLGAQCDFLFFPFEQVLFPPPSFFFFQPLFFLFFFL